jgi:hypothetical protein
VVKIPATASLALSMDPSAVTALADPPCSSLVVRISATLDLGWEAAVLRPRAAIFTRRLTLVDGPVIALPPLRVALDVAA